jgi:hypothetical protein
MQITDSNQDRRFSTNALAAIMLFAPAVLVMLNGGSGQIAVFGMVMVGGPLLIGLIAQRVKGRTGAVWWLFSSVIMMVVNVLAGGGASSEVLAKVILFGALPMSIIVATLPRRT